MCAPQLDCGKGDVASQVRAPFTFTMPGVPQSARLPLTVAMRALGEVVDALEIILGGQCRVAGHDVP